MRARPPAAQRLGKRSAGRRGGDMERRGKASATEPDGVPDASPGMSAQLHDRQAPAVPAGLAAPRQASEGDAAFDRWLRQELSRLYDSALSEPVPEELLRLLRPESKG